MAKTRAQLKTDNDEPAVGGAREISLGPLPDYLGYQVRQVQSAIFGDFTTITAETGVTPGEFSLLMLVEHNPGINQGALARMYNIDKSTLSIAVASLVKRGLVEKTPNEEDRRYHAVSLTPEGRDVLARTTRRVEDQERAMDAALKPGERQALLDMLKRLARAFR